MKLISNFFLAAAMLLVSCGKNEDPVVSGGLVTGKNKLIVSVVHHAYSLSGMEVFLKNDATEFPGTDTSVYEWSTVSDASGKAVFEKLFDGNYFLYAKGFDPNVGMEVIGAVQVTLNEHSVSNHEAHVTIYVTE